MTTAPHRLALVLSLLSLLPARASQAQPRPATGNGGYLPQLADPLGLLARPPLLSLSEPGAAARRLRPTDDGKGFDARAGDQIYSGHIEAEFVRPWIDFSVQAGQQRWRGAFSIKPRSPAQILIRLGRGGQVLAGSTAPSRTPRPGAAKPGNPNLPVGADPRARRSAPGAVEAVLWLALLASLALSLVLAVKHRGRPRAPGGDEAQPPGSWLHTPPRWLVLGLPAACAVTVSLPLLLRPGALAGPDTFRSFDWLETAKLDAFSRLSLLSGELPHWNPLLQGGVPQLCHPSDSTLSPLMLPTLLLGEGPGMKLNVVLALLLGALGTTLLGRDRLGLRPPFAVVAGCAYAVAGWVPSRVAVGYYESALYAFFPLVVWLFLESVGRPWRFVGAALLLGLAAMQIHLGLPMLMLALGLWCLLELCRGALPRSFLWRLPLLSAGAAGVAAVKLLPMWSYLRGLGFRRVEHYTTFDAFYADMADLALKVVAVVPAVGQYDAAGMPSRGDFGYVGLGPLLALLVGGALLLQWALPGGLRVIAALFVLYLWLCFGFNAPLDLFRPLWSLPLFHSMRGALRYFSFGLVWFGCLLAAGGLQLLASRLPWPRVKLPLALAVALAAVAWSALPSAGRYWSSFDGTVVPPRHQQQGFYQVAINPRDRSLHLGGQRAFDHGNLLLYANLKAGIGTVYPPEDLPSTPLVKGQSTFDVHTRSYFPDPTFEGDARCLAHDCQARVVQVGPNQISVVARFQQSDTLLLNFNASPRWTLGADCTHGWSAPRAVEGLLATRFEGQGAAAVTLRYRPPGTFWWGLVLSIMTLALLVGLALWLNKNGTTAAPASKNSPPRSPG